MIVVQGLLLNVGTIILSCIFSMLLSDFRTQGLRSIPTPPMMALTEFSHAGAEINVHPLPESWYFIPTSLWKYVFKNTDTMSISFSAADIVSFGSWPILFKVLKLSVTICAVLLHLSNFCLKLSSVADFSNTWARAPTLFIHAKGNMVWTYGLRVIVIFWWPYFYLISRHHPYRWVAVVSWQLFDPGCWPVGFFQPPLGETHRWLDIGFICLTSHIPCCFPWLLRFSLWFKKNSPCISLKI